MLSSKTISLESRLDQKILLNLTIKHCICLLGQKCLSSRIFFLVGKNDKLN